MPDRYLLLGQDVANSPTPLMMNAAFAAMGVDADYRAENVDAPDLDRTFRRLVDEGVRGMNVTIPHKASVVRLLDSLDEASSKIRAVNTLSVESGMCRGYNTDVDGIVVPLAVRRLSTFSHVVALGTGGAARALCAAMNLTGSHSLTFLSRAPGKAGALIGDLRTAFPEMELEVTSYREGQNHPPDLVFNASPAGSVGVPLPPEVGHILDSRPVVFDAVYSPVETELIRVASDKGCKIIHGHEMLLAQAVRTIEIWTGQPGPAETMKDALFYSIGVAVQ